MRRCVAFVFVLVAAVLLFSLACTGAQCDTSTLVTTGAEKTTLRFPALSVVLKLVEKVVGPIRRAGTEPKLDVTITLSSVTSLNVDLACECSPPCDLGAFQHARVGFTGTTRAFDGEVVWEESQWRCEPRNVALGDTSKQTVEVGFSRFEGSGRWVSTETALSVLFASMTEKEMAMSFEFQESCDCRPSCPSLERNSAPTIHVPPILALVRGEPTQFSITASDADADLVADCVKYSHTGRDDEFALTPFQGGSAGDEAQADFTVTAGVNAPDSTTLRFTAQDANDNVAGARISVSVWEGRPEIVLVEESTRWHGGTYITIFRIEDPDFAVGDGCRELVTWNVVDVAGGSVAFGDPNEGIEKGCRSATDTYCVVFTPDGTSPAGGQFTIEAVDKGGFRTTLTIPVSRPLSAVDDWFEDTRIARGSTAAFEGNVLANDLDPNTGSNRYLRVASRTAARFGDLVVFEDGAFTYMPYSLTHNYVLEPEVFQYTMTNSVLTSAPATVTIVVYAKPEARPAEVTLFAECTQGPPCARATIEILVHDADRVEGAGAYTFTAATYGGAGIAPAISFEGLEGRTSGQSSVPTGNLVTRTVTARLDRPLEAPESGDYMFTYLVTDPDGLSDVGTIVVHVSTANQPPVGEATHVFDLVYNVLFPEIYALDPIWYESGCLQFSDPERQPLRFRLTRFPTKGLVDLVPTFPSSRDPNGYSLQLLYRIGRGEALAAHRGVAPYNDSFVVEARDPFGAAAITQVIIRVTVLNSNPVCVRDAAATPSNAAVNIAVLANDTDPEDDPLTVASVSSAGHGTVALGGVRASAALHGGTGGALASAPAVSYVTYTPAKGFFGRDTFTYTVSDGHGGTGTGTVTVEVTDAEPPVFAWAPPEREPIKNDSGVCGAVVTWAPPVAGVDVTDNVGVTSLVASHAPGSVFPVGTTTVTYTAKDPAGNAATTSFEVVVEDCEPSGLDNVPADIVTAAAPGTTTKVVTWVPITATDNCGVANVTALPASGTAFPIGATKVIVTALDVHGNLTERSFTVTVNGPLSIAADNVDVLTEGDGETVTYGALTGGGCPPVVVVCDPESGSFFPLGTTTVDVTATDACGARVTGSFTVTVIQQANQAPIANADYAELGIDEILVSIPVLANDEDPEGDRICIVDIGAPTCGETYINPVAPDEVIFEAIGCGDYFGSQIWFTYTIEDEHGERATANAYVRIPDEGTLPRAPQGGG